MALTMDQPLPGPESVLSFWFEEISPRDWWLKSPEFDGRIATRFGAVHEAAARCELFEWRATAAGRLAEVIALDQFSRNIHRDTARAFAADPLALALAQEAIAAGADREFVADRAVFFLMPFMHSESRAIHAVAEPLFRERAPANLEHAQRHRAIVDRFGRFPHRNAILGRASTDEEAAFLKTPGSSF
jgi:uncharacterized protein (DUF924 family)